MRQMLQLSAELPGGKCLNDNMNDSAHLSSWFSLRRNTLKWTEINQEMQMRPADSLHN